MWNHPKSISKFVSSNLKVKIVLSEIWQPKFFFWLVLMNVIVAFGELWSQIHYCLFFRGYSGLKFIFSCTISFGPNFTIRLHLKTRLTFFTEKLKSNLSCFFNSFNFVSSVFNTISFRSCFISTKYFPIVFPLHRCLSIGCFSYQSSSILKIQKLEIPLFFFILNSLYTILYIFSRFSYI